MFHRIVSTIIFCFLVLSVEAQETPSVDELLIKFPGEKAVVINNSEHYIISTKGDKFNIQNFNEEEIIYLSDLGNMYSSKSLHYGSFTKIESIDAQTIIPMEKPGKFIIHKVKNFNTNHVSSAGIFYDDNQEISFNYPSIQKGARTKLKYTVEHTDPKFLGSSFFISHLPTLNSEVKITFPENVEIGYKLFNGDSSNIVFTESKQDGNITYLWKATNLFPFKSIEGAPEYTYYAPHIILYIKNIKLKSKSIEVFPDTKGYYKWCYSLTTKLNKTTDSSLKSITDSLVMGISDPDVKAKKIFYWVQDNIKYVAFEDGMGGFIPRQAAEVCQKRYGDCKDMASIITEMLKYANVPGDLTLIGARNLPYKYSEISTPSVDNHMIASYRNKHNQVVFLDATGSYTPYGFPTAMIQGKESLIGKGEHNYEIVSVPVVPKSKNLSHDKTELSFVDNTIKGKGLMTARGYAKLDYVYPLLNKNDKDREERFQNMIQKGNNKFLLESSTFKGLGDRDSAMNVQYTFTIQDYAQYNKDEIYINLNLDKKLSGNKIDVEKRRGVPLEFEYAFNDINEVVLSIPKGYSVAFMPKDASYESKHFGFEISYHLKNNVLHMIIEIHNDLLLLNTTHFEAWNQMIKKLNAAYKEQVILKKTPTDKK